MKKLLVVTPYFYPKIGGLENYAHNMCLGLKKKYKYEIVVVTSNHKEKKYKKEIIKGIKIYRLPYWFKVSNTPINPLWYFQIKRIVKRERPDLINAHTPVPFIADIAALTSGNIPFFVTYHALNLYKHTISPFNILIKIYKLFENILFIKSQKILIVSDVIRSSIPSKYRNKTYVINNSLPFKDIPKRKKMTKKENINIVFIGSLDKSHSWKGLKEVIESIKIYKDKYSHNINLYVIGEGNYKEYYLSLVEKYNLTNNIRFLGKKVGQKKKEILNNATFGIIYPISSNDAFPTVILEYWAQSITVIASNILPINKILKNKRTAYLVNPNNPQALANSINILMKNNNLVKKISVTGYQELNSKFVLEKEVKKFNDLINYSVL